MNAYVERDLNVGLLGFASYADYLDSPLWASIRAKVTGACVRCGKERRQVHHAAYDLETLKGERFDTLIPACQGCHDRAERLGKRVGGDERLHAATLYLLSGTKPPRRQKRPRRRDRGLSMTWRSERQAVAAAADIRACAKKRKARRVVNSVSRDMAPRLVK